MKNFLGKNLMQIIVLVLLIVILVISFDKCNKKIEYIEKVSVKKDTVWIHSINTVTSIPQIVETIRDTIETKTIEYLPSEDYAELKNQYLRLKDYFLSRTVIKDNLKIDSIGVLSVIDTLSKNKIIGRGYSYNFKYPVITNTVTIREPTKLRNQVYLGGMLSGNKSEMVNQVDLGILFKNKKDQMFGLKGGIDTKGEWNIGVQSYFKIRF